MTQGLLPCIAQDWLDGTVLMVGFMNQEAWDLTSTDVNECIFGAGLDSNSGKKGRRQAMNLLVEGSVSWIVIKTPF